MGMTQARSSSKPRPPITVRLTECGAFLEETSESPESGMGCQPRPAGALREWRGRVRADAAGWQRQTGRRALQVHAPPSRPHAPVPRVGTPALVGEAGWGCPEPVAGQVARVIT